MIPIRLEMKNFLPYTSPEPLRFDGIHLACLTGSNGAGKSSLLDAITWALWGKARARRDEDLVHLGQGDMWVQLDFTQEDTLYRVLRRRARGKRGQGTLDLFVFREDGSPNTISERTMTQTQIKINAILRLDYETFVHSAFLQQGKADAFTTKNPADRKKILSDILGLDRWTQYEDHVKEKLKEINNNVNYFEQRIHEIDRELSGRSGLERECDDAQRSHQEATAALQNAETHLEEMAGAPNELRAAQESRVEREKRLRNYADDLARVAAQVERQRGQISDYQQVIDAQDEIEAGYTALQSAREANQALSDTLLKLKSIDDERYHLRSQLEQARTRLEGEIRASEGRITELTAVSATDYSTQLEATQAEVAALQSQEHERDRLIEHVGDLRAESAGIQAMLDAVTNEGKELRDRLERLNAADADAAVCPLCGQPLGQSERTKLIGDLEGDIETKRELYRQNQERIKAIADSISVEQANVKTIEAALKDLSALRERVGVLHNQAETAQQAATRLTQEHDVLAQMQAELADEHYGEDLRAELAALDERHAAVGYDESSHKETRQQLEAHSQYEALHARLEVALETLPNLQANLDDALARQERLRAAEAEAQGEIATLDSELVRLAEKVKEYQARDLEVKTQRTNERTAYGRLVNAEQELKALEKQAERRKELSTRLDTARAEHALYDELKKAFGKNGVPAMIIETAIPELETAANDLLARMTDGRMHLRLNTQREKITGGVAETLDIEIADELGTRNYEMYSGGEAFRINFAIRVALSQMLARRAGAHLRTLFIDEGFGTQDADGRTKLVEAITTIQDAFSLILVITHIDELRDSFPVHIMVEKTASGSQLMVQ